MSDTPDWAKDRAREWLEAWERDWTKKWRDQLAPDLAALLAEVDQQALAGRDAKVEAFSLVKLLRERLQIAAQDRADARLRAGVAERELAEERTRTLAEVRHDPEAEVAHPLAREGYCLRCRVAVLAEVRAVVTDVRDHYERAPNAKRPAPPDDMTQACNEILARLGKL